MLTVAVIVPKLPYLVRLLVPNFIKSWFVRIPERYSDTKIALSEALFFSSKPELRKSILEKIHLSELLVHAPPEMLTPIGNFYRDGHNDLLYKHIPPTCKSVLILGGYLGDSASIFVNNLHKQKIVILEPVFEYQNILKHRFRQQSGITILPYAAGSLNENRTIAIDGERTSEFSSVSHSETVQFVDISNIFIEYGPFDLVELNIEGSEYEVLRRLDESNLIMDVEVLLVQFHKIDIHSSEQRLFLQQILSQTHFQRLNYDWVWERWDRNPKLKLNGKLA
jgi:FkbM family methyltransferase